MGFLSVSRVWSHFSNATNTCFYYITKLIRLLQKVGIFSKSGPQIVGYSYVTQLQIVTKIVFTHIAKFTAILPTAVSSNIRKLL